MRRTQAIQAILAAVIVAAAGLVSASPGVAAVKKGTSAKKKVTVPAVISVEAPADWYTFDIQGYGGLAGRSTTGGYDYLTAIYNGKLVPYLATSWKVAFNNKSVTFKLRKGVRCQDGTKLTPQDVAASFQRLFTVPKKGVSISADYGAGPFTVRANSKKWTVTIITGTAYRSLPWGTAASESAIVCPAGLANPTGLQTQFYGSGPYELASAVHGSQIVLKRNPHWRWGPTVNGKEVTWRDLPKTQIWKIVSNPMTAANDLLTNALDVDVLSGSALGRFAGNKRFRIQAMPQNFPLIMDFHFGAGHSTDSEALRHALAAIVNPLNLEKAVNAGQPGKLPPLTTSFVNPTQPCYDPKTKRLYKSLGIGSGVNKARAILEQAGYTGFGSKLTAPDGTPVVIRILTAPSLVGEGGPYLQQAFAPLGANVQLTDTDDLAVFAGALYGGKIDVGVTYGTFTSEPIDTSLIGYFVGNPVNAGGLNLYGPSPTENPTWNRLVTTAQGATGCVYWDRTQMYALQHFVAVPAAQSEQHIVVRKGFTVASGYYPYQPWTLR